MVLVKMNVLLDLKLDCPEIVYIRFSRPNNSILLPDFLVMVWIKSYLQSYTNVRIFCVYMNNCGNIRYIKILV